MLHANSFFSHNSQSFAFDMFMSYMIVLQLPFQQRFIVPTVVLGMGYFFPAHAKLQGLTQAYWQTFGGKKRVNKKRKQRKKSDDWNGEERECYSLHCLFTSPHQYLLQCIQKLGKVVLLNIQRTKMGNEVVHSCLIPFKLRIREPM